MTRAAVTRRCWLAGTVGAPPSGPVVLRDDRMTEWLFDGLDTCTYRDGRYACSWFELHTRTDLVEVPGEVSTLPSE